MKSKLIIILTILFVSGCTPKEKPELKFDSQIPTVEYGIKCELLIEAIKSTIVWGKYEEVNLVSENCTYLEGYNNVEIVATLKKQVTTYSVKIKVEDTRFPEFTKTPKGNIELIEGENFNLLDYYSGEDPVDGALEPFINNKIDTSIVGEHSREVILKDSNGNQSTKIMIVVVKPKKRPSAPDQPNNNNINSISKESNNSTSTNVQSYPAVDTSQLTRYFLFEDGYDINTSMDACFSYIQEMNNKYNVGGACYPIKEDVYKGAVARFD